MTIQWEPPVSDGGAPLTGYIVEMRNAKESKYKLASKVDGQTLTYTADGLTEGVKYTFRVKAENPAGVSENAVKLDKAVKVEDKIGQFFCNNEWQNVWNDGCV